MGYEEDIASIKRLLHKLAGGDGIDIFNDNILHEGEWVRIGIIQPTVFTCLETENGNELIEAITFDSGVDIYSEFKKICLESGAIIAYKE